MARRKPTPVPVRRRSGPQWLKYAGLLIVTLLAYMPVWHGGVLWDDDAHLTRSALRSVEGLWRIWFDVGATQQYYPVLHSAFWVLHRLFGDQTLGYHLFSITLHGASAAHGTERRMRPFLWHEVTPAQWRIMRDIVAGAQPTLEDIQSRLLKAASIVPRGARVTPPATFAVDAAKEMARRGGGIRTDTDAWRLLRWTS